jgi:hypothetical protein
MQSKKPVRLEVIISYGIYYLCCWICIGLSVALFGYVLWIAAISNIPFYKINLIAVFLLNFSKEMEKELLDSEFRLELHLLLVYLSIIKRPLVAVISVYLHISYRCICLCAGISIP